MNDIRIKKGEGGLGRTLPTHDHYCGLLVYAGDLPDGFAADDVQKIPNLKQAEKLGITEDAPDPVIKVLYYHLSRFFEVYALKGITPALWVCVAPEPETNTKMYFDELQRMEEKSNGEIRRFGVFTRMNFAVEMCDRLQTVLVRLENAHYPASAILAANFSTYNNADSLFSTPDLRNLEDSKVSVTIGQDGDGKGAILYKTLKFSITDLGSILAWSTIKAVHENIGWVEKFNVAFNVEYDVPVLANGSDLNEDTELGDDLNGKGYIFLRKHVGTSGTYFNDSHTCISEDSDYAYMENNDTIDKAIRGIRAALLPKLNSPLQIDPETGQLDVTTTSYLESLTTKPLDEMKAAGELSGASVTINPEQNVLSSSALDVVVKLVINGVARRINVNIGFTNKLS